MKSFKEYIKEEMMPYAQTEKGFVGVDNGPVRDNINLLLSNVTSCSYATPYHAMEVIRKVLAPFSIFPPATNFLDGQAGHEVFEIKQFGDKIGFTNDGSVVVKNSSPYFLYFEYSLSYGGAFDIFCEIVDQDELDEILADVEDEMEDEDTTTGDEKDAEDTFDSYKADNQKLDEEVKKPTGGLKKACWKGYTAVGMKNKGGKKVPNCVPISEDQLNEISKILAGKYLDKNEKSREKLASKSGLHGPGIKRTAENDKAEKKLMSRVKSRNLALAKKYPQYGGAKVAATEETLNELSKKTLGNYIKNASHSVATLSAATRGFARDADAQRKDKKPMDARKSDERSDKTFKKSWNRRKYMAKAVDKLTKEEKSADTHTGALTMNGKPVVSPTATSVQPTFPPKNVPVPKPRPKNLEEANPAREGEIAAGRKGSNPAEQGAIAVKRDDERRDRKANFKVAKKLARQAMKQVKNKK